MKVLNTETPKHPKLRELYILLNTQRGTVPLHRDLGLDNRMIDKPVTVIRNGIFGELQQQISKYIKGLKLENVTCNITDTGLKIECEVSIIE